VTGRLPAAGPYAQLCARIVPCLYARAAGTMPAMESERPQAIIQAGDEDDQELDDAEDDSAAVQQVPSYIAVIRIVAVLGMGLCVSFGLFISLVGLKGVLIGIPVMLLAIPCYYGMQAAERLATRAEQAAAARRE